MKKIFLVMVLAVSGVFAVNAQVDGNAIGLRLGYGGEISYQHALGSSNRLELDLGTYWHDIEGANLTGVYQWVWDLSALSKGFNWYAGAGAYLGYFSEFGIGVAGQVGIEYNFDFPLQLSLDYRPALSIIPAVHFGSSDICLGVRYKF
ncbi:hypothetical protein FACS189413_07430 [Bacteroidia bacterium]|nr:hypothetical protein FACS189413_07430 [Bacteroidia bacterium]